MIVSSEKITWFQSIPLWSCAHFKRFIRRFPVSNGFDKGRLYFATASLRRRRTVLSLILIRLLFNWFMMSQFVTNVCRSASETISRFSFGVVARIRPVRSESFKYFDCFHSLSQYCIVDVLHLTAFGTDLWPSFGLNGCWDKKTISYRWCIGKTVVQSSSPKMISMILIREWILLPIYTILMESSCISRKFWGSRDFCSLLYISDMHRSMSDSLFFDCLRVKIIPRWVVSSLYVQREWCNSFIWCFLLIISISCFSWFS